MMFHEVNFLFVLYYIIAGHEIVIWSAQLGMAAAGSVNKSSGDK